MSTHPDDAETTEPIGMNKKNKTINNECSAASPSASEMAAHLDAVTHSQMEPHAADRLERAPGAHLHLSVRTRAFERAHTPTIPTRVSMRSVRRARSRSTPGLGMPPLPQTGRAAESKTEQPSMANNDQQPVLTPRRCLLRRCPRRRCRRRRRRPRRPGRCCLRRCRPCRRRPPLADATAALIATAINAVAAT